MQFEKLTNSEKKKAIRALYRKGLSAGEIAKTLKTKKANILVFNCRNCLGLNFVGRTPRSVLGTLSDQKLIKLYRKLRSFSGVARALGTDPTTVSNYLKRRGAHFVYKENKKFLKK